VGIVSLFNAYIYHTNLFWSAFQESLVTYVFNPTLSMWENAKKLLAVGSKFEGQITVSGFSFPSPYELVVMSEGKEEQGVAVCTRLIVLQLKYV
jgi:hypothetical protein